MRKYTFVLALVAVLAIALPFSASAQSRHIADTSVMQTAVQKQVTTEAADRAVILKVLKSDAAVDVAQKMGLNLTTAENAVSLLSGSELSERAASARTIEAAQTGGQSVVVISATSLLLIIIIIILLVK